jgi:hypothetical protein
MQLGGRMGEFILMLRKLDLGITLLIKISRKKKSFSDFDHLVH